MTALLEVSGRRGAVRRHCRAGWRDVYDSQRRYRRSDWAEWRGENDAIQLPVPALHAEFGRYHVQGRDPF